MKPWASRNSREQGAGSTESTESTEPGSFSLLPAPRSVLRRGGMTLVEVILVLALLVVIGALSVPILEGSFTRGRLQHGGDLLRAAWTKARLAAAESGQTYVFRFEPGGSRYQAFRLAEMSQPDSAAIAPEAINADWSATDVLRLGKARLPQGVVFAGGTVAESPQVTAMLGDVSGSGWSAPILFRPDGTTTDASLILTNERGQRLRVTLRGLTGVSRISEDAAEVAP